MAATIDLRGTVALVTGASRGLGRAFALALAAAGADLGLVARGADDLGRVAREAAAQGVRAEVLIADLRREPDVAAAVDGTVRAFGRIDVLVNNAGISGEVKPFIDLAPGEWDAVLDMNLRAPMLCAQAAARQMVEQGGGRIINVASIAALAPITRLAPYCASKAGLVQLTRVMALELARHKVWVNALCPGYFATPMNQEFFQSPPGRELIQRAIPMRRLGDPGELAPMVVFLASPAAGFMTGSVVVVDGGQTLT
jgi:NAD(P)-dependent dehydrogenase (short-subunit alcohol dehydrogenase family)